MTEGAGRVFVTGGTGYIGRRLIPVLLARGYTVRALVRPGSERRLPPGCEAHRGDALDRKTFQRAIEPGDTVVQLVGVPHPSPFKAKQFFDVDLVSARETIAAAEAQRAGHFVYVSVAQPAPVMKAYQTARAVAEGHLAKTSLPATILRPFYVLGPGHRWPMALTPIYAVLERVPSTRASALRLGLVTIHQMVAALVWAIDAPPVATRFFTVPDIRKARL
jgi:nucleoside-diphosphate-sugar epimerase